MHRLSSLNSQPRGIQDTQEAAFSSLKEMGIRTSGVKRFI